MRPGSSVVPGQRDRHASLGAVICAFGPDGLDFVAAHEHGPAVVRRAVAVPDSIRDEKGWRTDRRGAASTAPGLVLRPDPSSARSNRRLENWYA